MSLVKNMFIDEGDFQTKVGKDLFWVPYRSLGDISEGKERISVLDALLYFMNSNFQEKVDTVKVQKEGHEWELHRKGQIAMESGYGCCSSIASWVCHELKDKYDEVGIIALQRPTGSGHAINYVEFEGYYYIFDSLPFLSKYPQTLKETGQKADFMKVKFLTSCCLKTTNLNNFSQFFGRLMRIAGYDQLFFQIKELAVPPTAIEINLDNLNIFFPSDKNIIPLIGVKSHNMKFSKMEIDFSDDLISDEYFF